MSGNVEYDQNNAEKDEMQDSSTGGNKTLNVNGASLSEVDIKTSNDNDSARNGGNGPGLIESNAKPTTNNLHNRSSPTSLTQSNWVKFDSDESRKDSKVLLN